MFRMGTAFLAVLALAAEGGSRMTGAAPAPSGGLLLVANKGDHTLGIIDPATGKQVATVEESGVTGHEVIASPDGRTAYVPIYGNSGVGRPGTDGQTMDVIDIASRRRVATIDFGRAERPHDSLVGPDGRLYVTTEITNTVTVIDPKTNQIVDRIPTGQPESHMLALTRDGKRAYTSNVHVGTVSAIDLSAKKVTAGSPSRPTRSASRCRSTTAGSSPPTRRSPGSPSSTRGRISGRSGWPCRASPMAPRPRLTAAGW